MESKVWIEWIGNYPWMLFVAIAILPGLGVPNCPMLILCGTAMTAALGVRDAVLLAVGAVIVNILWTWWVAAYPFRDLIQRKVESRLSDDLRERIRMDDRSVLMITLLLHVTPGVPLFIQNYFPGFNRLAFWKYLAIAVPVQALYTALIVVSSGQIFKAFKAYPILVLIVGISTWLAIRFQRRARVKSPLV